MKVSITYGGSTYMDPVYRINFWVEDILSTWQFVWSTVIIYILLSHVVY